MDIHKCNTLSARTALLCVLMLAGCAAAQRSTSLIDCFQCNSTHERTCAENLPQHHSLAALSCAHLQEAQYCVKMTGMFEGELGTKRFCSARDWGNYCEWVRRPGDEREYRACVFTCGWNGCNSASSIVPVAALTVLLVGALKALC